MKYTKNYKFKKPEPYDTRNINDINDSFDLVDAKLKETQDNNENLKATFEQLTINAGESNAEIVAARRDKFNNKTYNSVPDRLDAVSSLMAQTAKELNQTKVDQTVYEAGLGNLASGTPLFATSVTEMSDTTKLYCNMTDGYIYYYTGSMWKSTEKMYQSDGIEDGAVTNKKIAIEAIYPSRINFTGNFVSVYKFEQGGIASTGNNNESNTRIRTSFSEKVPTGTKIRIKNDSYTFCPYLYDIMLTEFSDHTITSPHVSTPNTWLTNYTVAEDCYLRLSIRKSDNSDISPTVNITDIIVVENADEKPITLLKQVPTDEIGELTRKTIRKKNAYVHISFDDVEFCFTNLTTNKSIYRSIFEEPFFKKLKEYHDKYGAVFSLYVYANKLTGLDSKFAGEFLQNSSWLKIGYHSFSGENADTVSASTAISNWNTFINSVYTITGGLNSIDRIPRLHGFGGNLSALKAIKSSNCGAIGFLSTDDTRKAYYLTTEQCNYLQAHDKLIDYENGLVFLSTDFRLDWFYNGFTSDYVYDAPTHDNPYNELVYRYNLSSNADKFESMIVFTHEWRVYDGVAINSTISYVEQVCQFTRDYCFDFDFPQNRVNCGINDLLLGVAENHAKQKIEFVIDTWELGSIDGSGKDSESSIRIRSGFIHFSKNSSINVKVPNGYKCNVVKYTANRSDASCYVSATGWQSNSVNIIDAEKHYYRVVIGKIDDSEVDISVAELFGFYALTKMICI